MKKTPAKEIMTSPVLTIRNDETISSFIDGLLDKGINGMPVVDKNGKLEGIATRTDLFAFELKRELGIIYEKNLQDNFNEHMTDTEWLSFKEMTGSKNRTLTVRDIMVKNVITADKETTVKEICSIMKTQHINHVIITSDGEIAGIITSRDIINLIADED
jgi:CBS domain-containing protein